MSIKVQDLTYIYGQGTPFETTALSNISFEIEAGQFVGIIGHTGSGKSTLIQHLNGLIKPHSGHIFIDGADITEKDAKLRDFRRKIGLVFQYPEYQLFEETVAKDVAFGPGNLGLDESEIQQRVRDALDLVGLDYDAYAERSPFELSGGQKRRAAIAGVIAMVPEVLILDEPTAGLDPQGHKEILHLIKRIHQEQKNITILVSHNMQDVAELCDRVLVLDKGKLLLSGTPREVFRHADLLRQIGLGLPPAALLLQQLKSNGADLSTDAITMDEAEEIIAAYLKKKEML